jgi:hypothetical protein
MTALERIAFLTAYEDLGAGGLTPDEIIELAILRAEIVALEQIRRDDPEIDYRIEILGVPYVEIVNQFGVITYIPLNTGYSGSAP